MAFHDDFYSLVALVLKAVLIKQGFFALKLKSLYVKFPFGKKKIKLERAALFDTFNPYSLGVVDTFKSIIILGLVIMLWKVLMSRPKV